MTPRNAALNAAWAATLLSRREEEGIAERDRAAHKNPSTEAHKVNFEELLRKY